MARGREVDFTNNGGVMPDDPDDDWEMCDDDDPNEDRYCIYCDTYLPQQCFMRGDNICNDCLDERRYGPRCS